MAPTEIKNILTSISQEFGINFTEILNQHIKVSNWVGQICDTYDELSDLEISLLHNLTDNDLTEEMNERGLDIYI